MLQPYVRFRTADPFPGRREVIRSFSLIALEVGLEDCEIKGSFLSGEFALLLFFPLYGFNEFILSLDSTVFEKECCGDRDPHLSKLEELNELLLLLCSGVEAFFGEYVILAKVPVVKFLSRLFFNDPRDLERCPALLDDPH